MNKFVKALIWVVAIFAVAFVGGAFWHGGGEFVVEGLFSSYEIWLIFFLGLALVSIPKLKHVFDLGSGGRDKEAGMGKTKDGQKLSQYYDAENILPPSTVKKFCFIQISRSKSPAVLNHELIIEMPGTTVSKHFYRQLQPLARDQ